jgi:uncharacterized membrane protein YcaP (DUF421 family)
VFDVDWQHLFAIERSLAELFVRGTVMYWFLFLLFRFVLHRDIGALGISDVLLVVLIADASQNAMDDGYRSVTEGIALVATLAFWNYLINWLSFRSKGFARFAEPRPLLLVRDGRLLEGNLRREMLTRDELMAQLREQSIERLDEVRWAYMESDGRISVRRIERPSGGKPPKRSRAMHG